MRHARTFYGALIALLAATAVAMVVAAVSAPGRRGSSGGNDLGNPPGMVDRLDFFESGDDWHRGQRQRVAVSTLVMLDDGRNDAFPRAGTWTSPEVPTPFRFTELLPSWNVTAPKDTGLRLEVRVRAARSGRWSPWLFVGSWGRTPAGERVTRCRQGVVNVDYVALDVPADAYQVRVGLFSFDLDKAITPSVRRVAVCYSGVVKGARFPAEVRPTSGPAWQCNLPVPFRTQKDAPKSLSSEICSPTSVSMVMAYWGVDRPTVENALAVYDPDNEMFGNWGRAVARAGELGLDAWLARFRDWDRVRAEIAAGRPVVASVRFKRGEFPSAVLPETDGHLIVIRGFTPAGDVIVNDPASRERGDGAIYKADELARAWFGHGGVGYVICRKAGPGGGTALARRLGESATKE